MLRILILLLIIIPVIELWGLITMGKWIGAWFTIALVICTGVLGAWLAKREGMQTLHVARLQLSKGKIPGFAVLDGICILLGGAFLLTPGFFKDTVGFFLLLPWTRNIVKAWLRQRFEEWLRTGRFLIIRK